MFGVGHRRDAVTRIERGEWTSKERDDRATAASARSLACESRLRRPERRRCVLTLPTSLEMSRLSSNKSWKKRFGANAQTLAVGKCHGYLDLRAFQGGLCRACEKGGVDAILCTAPINGAFGNGNSLNCGARRRVS
jgi:hypothetical protein